MTKHLNLDLEREKRQAAAQNMSDFDTPQSDQHGNTSCHNGKIEKFIKFNSQNNA